ncbi:hypothetical protein [Rhizorhabdus argentea]
MVIELGFEVAALMRKLGVAQAIGIEGWSVLEALRRSNSLNVRPVYG